MPLYKAIMETTYVKRSPDGFGDVGHTYARGHDLIVQASDVKDAAQQVKAFIDGRHKVEDWLLESYKDDPKGLEEYEPFYGPLGAVKIFGWAPHLVASDGDLKDAPGFAGRGYFEWKCDFPFTFEQSIEHIDLSKWKT